MKYVGFNVNGIRARLHQLEQVLSLHNPDVLALQETKVVNEEFPADAVAEIGFEHQYIYGQKGHYGVALLSKTPLTDVQLGFPWRAEDQQRRFIAATYAGSKGPIRLMNGYFPQGESREHPTKFPAKAQYYQDLLQYLNETQAADGAVLVTGDVNVAKDDVDIGIGPDNAKRWLKTGKASFLPEEREWLQALMAWGLHDTYADQVGEERLYSWFDYRSRGFEREPKRGLRIDLMLASQGLVDAVGSCGIDYEIRGSDKPSDHCPIWCELDW
jgi:exodeoxyribonuclease-3